MGAVSAGRGGGSLRACSIPASSVRLQGSSFRSGVNLAGGLPLKRVMRLVYRLRTHYICVSSRFEVSY